MKNLKTIKFLFGTCIIALLLSIIATLMDSGGLSLFCDAVGTIFLTIAAFYMDKITNRHNKRDETNKDKQLF